MISILITYSSQYSRNSPILILGLTTYAPVWSWPITWFLALIFKIVIPEHILYKSFRQSHHLIPIFLLCLPLLPPRSSQQQLGRSRLRKTNHPCSHIKISFRILDRTQILPASQIHSSRTFWICFCILPVPVPDVPAGFLYFLPSWSVFQSPVQENKPYCSMYSVHSTVCSILNRGSRKLQLDNTLHLC